MSPVGWKDHTHVCSACDNIYACDGTCLCPLCTPYRRAVEENEREALADQDISRHERLMRGTPVGRRERRAFDRYVFGDEG